MPKLIRIWIGRQNVRDLADLNGAWMAPKFCVPRLAPCTQPRFSLLRRERGQHDVVFAEVELYREFAVVANFHRFGFQRRTVVFGFDFSDLVVAKYLNLAALVAFFSGFDNGNGRWRIEGGVAILWR